MYGECLVEGAGDLHQQGCTEVSQRPQGVLPIWPVNKGPSSYSEIVSSQLAPSTFGTPGQPGQDSDPSQGTRPSSESIELYKNSPKAPALFYTIFSRPIEPLKA